MLGAHELPRSKQRGIEHPSLNSFRGKPRGIEPEEIKLLGVSLTLDDFGIGYSSLSSLKGLPFDRVKIDRSFIRELPENSQDAALTKVIIAMASALNLEVVAEGVETQAQLDFLTGIGCTTVQGYLIGRPQDAAMVETLLKATAVPV